MKRFLFITTALVLLSGCGPEVTEEMAVTAINLFHPYNQGVWRGANIASPDYNVITREGEHRKLTISEELSSPQSDTIIDRDEALIIIGDGCYPSNTVADLYCPRGVYATP